METKIISEEKNPFLERSEIVAEVTNDVNPSNDSVVEALGKGEEITVIKKIGSNFGKNTFKVEAVVYDSQESKEKIETIPAKVKKKIEAERKAAEDKKKAEEEAAKKAEEEAKAAAEEAKKAEAEAKAAPVEEPVASEEAPAAEEKTE